jgi:nicotinamidase-related amidase
VQAVIVVDMQVGLHDGTVKHDLDGVIDRINRLTARTRQHGGAVIWIRHCGKPGEDFARDSRGWAFLPELHQHMNDIVVEKTLNDPFAGTTLGSVLDRLTPERVLVTGWATDFCVDATVRAAVSRGHRVVVVADAHTLADRPHLSAVRIIEHHHYVWRNLIAAEPVSVERTEVVVSAPVSGGGSR